MEVLVTDESPVDVAYQPAGIDGDSVLVLHPYQSHEYAVQEVASHLPATPLDEVVALVRKYLPNAISVQPTRDPAPAPVEPARPVSTTRSMLGVVGLLSSVVILPLLALGSAHALEARTSNDDARALLRAFEVKCWGTIQFDRRMGCAAEQDTAVVTLTHAEETGLVMLMEEDETASMVVQMSSPDRAADAIEHGLGRMLVGDNPTAVGPYIVTSTAPERQGELESMARTAALIADLPKVASMSAPQQLPSASITGDVSVTRVGDRPIMRSLGITSPTTAPPGPPMRTSRPPVPLLHHDRPALPSDLFMRGPGPVPVPIPERAPSKDETPAPTAPAEEPVPAPAPTTPPAPEPPEPRNTPTTEPSSSTNMRGSQSEPIPSPVPTPTIEVPVPSLPVDALPLPPVE